MHGENIPSGQGIKRPLEGYKAVAVAEGGGWAGDGEVEEWSQIQPWTGGKPRTGWLPQAGTHVGRFSGCQTGFFRNPEGSLQSSYSLACSTQDKPAFMNACPAASMPILEN